MKELSLKLLPHPPADTHGTCNRSITADDGHLAFRKIVVDALTHRIRAGKQLVGQPRVMMTAAGGA